MEQQSRIMSLVEVAMSTLIGFGVSLWANSTVLPMFGFNVKLAESFVITIIFTLISMVRSYLVRRLFAVHLKRFAAWCQRVYDGEPFARESVTGFSSETARYMTMSRLEFMARALSKMRYGTEDRWEEMVKDAWAFYVKRS